MRFVKSNIDSHSIKWELKMFINISMLRLRSMDWKSSLILLFDIKAARSTSASGSPCRSKFNLVGPRDYRSNIRKIIYAKSKDETTQVSHNVYQKSELIKMNYFYHVYTLYEV